MLGVAHELKMSEHVESNELFSHVFTNSLAV